MDFAICISGAIAGFAFGWFAAGYQHLLYRELSESPDAFLSGLAAKAVKEVSYHRELAADWTIRLGVGNGEGARGMEEGCSRCGRFRPDR